MVIRLGMNVTDRSVIIIIARYIKRLLEEEGLPKRGLWVAQRALVDRLDGESSQHANSEAGAITA
jgi:hypothetical protein